MAVYSNVGWAELTAGATWTNLVNTFNPSFSDASVYTEGGDLVSLPVSTVTQEAWFSFSLYQFAATPINNPQPIITVANTQGVSLLEIRSTGNGGSYEVFVQTNGSVGFGTMTLQTTLSIPDATLQRFDIRIVASTTGGVITIFRNLVQIVNVTGLNTGNSAIRRALLQAPSPNQAGSRRIHWSEFIVGEDVTSSTLRLQSYSSFPQANSLVHAAWSGGFVNLIKNAPYSQSSGWIISDAASQRSAFATTLVMPSAVDRVVVQISLNSRGVRPNGSPLDYSHYLRNTGGLITPTVALGASQIVSTNTTRWDTNPITGLPWSFADLIGLQFGVVSV